MRLAMHTMQSFAPEQGFGVAVLLASRHALQNSAKRWMNGNAECVWHPLLGQSNFRWVSGGVGCQSTTMGKLLPLTLAGTGSTTGVVVEPVVLMTICDAYIRRGKGQERIIGALLGKMKEGIITISTCFAIPHTEEQEVKLDMEHIRQLLKNYSKVFTKEVLVGWFSTNAAISPNDTLIHSYFRTQCSKPIHDPVLLTVDTSLQDDDLAIHAYVAKPLTLHQEEVAMEFREVMCTVSTAQAERVGADLLLQQRNDTATGNAASLEESITKLQDLLDGAYQYVEEVAGGKRQGSSYLGRHLAETVGLVPHLSHEDMLQVLGQAQDDVMLVTYLTSMLKAQLALADRLGTLQLPLM